MVIKDLFVFDEDEYAIRISQYDSQRLYKQEIVKTRQQYSAACSIGGGIGGAAFTYGTTLAVAGYGWRRMYVAKKKQALLQKELRKRGIEPHKWSKRDALIPLAAAIVGAGLGLGLEHVAVEATNTIVCGLQVPTGGSAAQAVVTHPGDAAQGLIQGMQEQGREMDLWVSGIGHGVSSGQALAAATTWTPASDAAQAVGFHAGMLSMQGVEKGMAGLLGSEGAQWIMQKCESSKHASTPDKRQRMKRAFTCKAISVGKS